MAREGHRCGGLGVGSGWLTWLGQLAILARLNGWTGLLDQFRQALHRFTGAHGGLRCGTTTGRGLWGAFCGFREENKIGHLALANSLSSRSCFHISTYLYDKLNNCKVLEKKPSYFPTSRKRFSKDLFLQKQTSMSNVITLSRISAPKYRKARTNKAMFQCKTN